MSFYRGIIIIPILLFLLPFLWPTFAKDSVTLALKSTDDGANNTEAIRQALDGFTTCVIQKSGINSMLPEFLTESIRKIFGEQCNAEQPMTTMRSALPKSGLENLPRGDATVLPDCEDHAPKWPLIPDEYTKWEYIQQHADCCRNGIDLKCYYGRNDTETGHLKKCWKSNQGKDFECSADESAPKCFCADKDAEAGDKTREDNIFKCIQKCHDTCSKKEISSGGFMTRSVNCSYTRPTFSTDFEQNCWIYSYKEEIIGAKPTGATGVQRVDQTNLIECAPPSRKVSFSEKMLNASLECMSEVDSLQCCTREDVARECMPLCGHGDVKTLSMKQLSVCQLHFGSIMKCYVEKVTGKVYNKSQEQCAEACAICDSVKACSLAQFLPGSLGDFALSLCLAEGNMQCKLAKLRGGCL